MPDPFVGEIRVFAFEFPPVGWALCDGSLLQIQDYGALYSLLGIRYGGDGRVTFGLPDLRGRAVISFGQGLYIQYPYPMGQLGGAEKVVIQPSQMPVHSHALNANKEAGDKESPTGNFSAGVNGGRGGIIPAYSSSKDTVRACSNFKNEVC